MSKPIDQAVAAAPTGARPTTTTPAPPPTAAHDGELSTKAALIAVAIFAVMAGLFAYGFYLQQHIESSPAPPIAPAVPGTHPVEQPIPAAAATPAAGPLSASARASAAPLDTVHADVYFDFGKTRVRAEAVAALQAHVAKMTGAGHWGVLIQGYADHHGPATYNKTLALKRGEAVKQLLIELGMPAQSMKVVSLGQEAAVCADETATCRRLSRRVHLEFVKLETGPPAEPPAETEAEGSAKDQIQESPAGSAEPVPAVSSSNDAAE
ncbi:OmpA family protein [Candidatus Nitrospira bockiana]